VLNMFTYKKNNPNLGLIPVRKRLGENMIIDSVEILK